MNSTKYLVRSLWSWRSIPSNLLGSLGVVLFAAIPRIGWISSPQGLIFDEVYYQREAYSLLVAGYELQWPADGEASVLRLDQPAFSAHPPFGKWVIAFFMNLASDTPGAFRIGPVVCGILLVVAVMAAVFLLTTKLLWANLAGLLLAIDGLAIATSRIAMLDGIMTTFIVTGFVFLLLHIRSRTLGAPFSFFRSWLLPAGLFLGLAVATKWSAIAFLLTFLVIVIVFELRLIGTASTHPQKPGQILRTMNVGIQFFVPAAAVYVISWAGWFSGIFSYGSYLDDYTTIKMPAFLAWLPLEWYPFILHHIDMATRVSSLVSNHNGLSDAWQWPLMLKPTLFAYEEISTGLMQCTYAGGCIVSWSTVSNPFVWYPAIVSALVLMWLVVKEKSGSSILILSGILAGFVPWVFLQRDQYFYYAIAMLPFLIMGLVFVLSKALEPSESTQMTKRNKNILVGYSAAAIICGLFFLPLALHTPMPTWFWNLHIWLPGWGLETFQPFQS